MTTAAAVEPITARVFLFGDTDLVLAFACWVKGGVWAGRGRPAMPAVVGEAGWSGWPRVRRADEAPWCGRLSCAPSEVASAGGRQARLRRRAA